MWFSLFLLLICYHFIVLCLNNWLPLFSVFWLFHLELCDADIWVNFTNCTVLFVVPFCLCYSYANVNVRIPIFLISSRYLDYYHVYSLCFVSSTSVDLHLTIFQCCFLGKRTPVVHIYIINLCGDLFKIILDQDLNWKFRMLLFFFSLFLLKRNIIVKSVKFLLYNHIM